MNKFFRLSVKKKIKLKHSTQEVWRVISSPGNLNLFHPFCKSNKVIKLDHSIIKRDKLVYHNGLTFFRDFYQWDETKGYKLFIGTKDGKKSKVEWKLSPQNHHSLLSIEIFPYISAKYPVIINYVLFFLIIKPNLKRYLLNVLNGLELYMDRGVLIEKNQFGKHRWFSDMR